MPCTEIAFSKFWPDLVAPNLASQCEIFVVVNPEGIERFTSMRLLLHVVAIRESIRSNKHLGCNILVERLDSSHNCV